MCVTAASSRVIVPCLSCSCSLEHSCGGGFSPLEACTAPSDNMKAGPQEGNVQVRSILDPLGPVSKVHCVFSNKDLLLTCGSQSRAAAMASNVGEPLAQSRPTTDQQGVFVMPSYPAKTLLLLLLLLLCFFCWLVLLFKL